MLSVLAAYALLTTQGQDLTIARPAPSNAKTMAAFEHVSSKLNNSNNWTTIDHPKLNGNPNAILLVTRVGRLGENAPQLGVWYNAGRWTIFNQDKSPMLANRRFVVEAFEPGTHAFVHEFKGPGNHMAPLPLTANGIGQGVFVTAAYTGSAIYNDHPLSTWYDGSKWNIVQSDREPMDVGAAFHVVYARADFLGATSEDSTDFLALDAPYLNGQTEAMVTLTAGYNQATSAYVDAAWSAAFEAGKWNVVPAADEALPDGAAFFVRVSGRRELTAVTTQQGTLTQAAKFRLTFLGFTVVRESADDLLERDGKGDELVFFADVAKGKVGEGSVVQKPWESARFGDINRADSAAWIQAGSRSDRGGLRTGDTYPSPLAIVPPSTRTDGLPAILWEDRLGTGDIATIVPAVWEFDGGQPSDYIRYRISNLAVRSSTEPTKDGLGAGARFTLRHTGGDAPPGWGDLRYRQRGRLRRGGPGFNPKAIFLTYETATALASAAGPLGAGTFTVRQGTTANNRGCVDMHFRVERVN